MMKNLFIGAALAVAVALFAPTEARAQYGAHMQMRAYEQQSHARWLAEREYLYGPMDPVRRTMHNTRVALDETKHTLKNMVGNPDFQHYTRFDRRPLGLLGPYPSGAAYGGMGGVVPGFGAPVIRQAPVMGGPALNQTGGSRYPTRWNPNSRLFW